ncbi:MAG: CocE/NonD family hydrolase [Acidimicrobiales bacterium]
MHFTDAVARVRPRLAAVVVGAAVALTVPGVALASGPQAAAPIPAANQAAAAGYRTELLHFEVHVGPGSAETCDVIGELFIPNAASAAHRVPAILTTNGFGGSYSDQMGIGQYFAGQGYVVLSYSGLGFGGSGCKITLDDPTYDGEAASQLVSFLGGAPGIAFTDAAHTQPVAGLDDVIHDSIDHAGHHDTYDPRVGMIGGSYGGEVQFATAAIDPRVDTIVPLITWNNLNYSLAPNNAAPNNAAPNNSDLLSGLAAANPGVTKTTWIAAFSAEGMADGLQGAQGDPSRLVGCPNFANWVCPGLVASASLGYPDAATAAHLTHASVASYLDQVRIPTLLMQGENDTLFNLNEAVATYQGLQAQGTTVKMIWQSWGHSDTTPAPGELNLSAPDPTTQYEAARIADWFGHYLKDQRISTGPGFAYFRDWVPYSGNAAPAYGTAPSYPVGSAIGLYLSGGGSLVARPDQITGGAQALVTPPAGLPTSVSSIDVVNSSVMRYGQLPDVNVPGTYGSWTSDPLASSVDVVGVPTLDVTLSAPAAALSQLGGPAGQLVLFAKLYDVSPAGTAQLVHGLIAPVRVADVNRPVHITLPAIAHRFASGDRIEIMLAGGDLNYRAGLVPTAVTVETGGAGQVLSLPVVKS